MESKEAKDSTKNGAAGQPRATKPAGAEPKTDSQGTLKQTTDTVPKLPGKEIEDGLHQAPQDGKNGLGTQSPGSSLRWLLGLDR
ncbi:hypothetical protein [Arthrobacter sp. NA-172]|uniref:hypothetical protein n=1 Tax=Arthrobacter sp. NA-172 TaxID=3367524 RepID=UPI003754F3C9